MAETTHKLGVLIETFLDDHGWKDLTFNLQQAKKGLISNQFAFSRFSSDISGVTDNFDDLMRAGKLAQDYGLKTQYLEKFGLTMRETGEIIGKSRMSTASYNKALKNLTKTAADPVLGFEAFKRAQYNGRRFMQEFEMWTLGFIFGGMVIARFFQKILTSGVATYQQLTQGQTAQAQALTVLSANWTYLKFAMGEAIGTAFLPLIPIIVRLVQSFVDFISQHPKLVGWIVILGMAFGYLVMTIGQLLAFTNSVILFWVKMAAVFAANGGVIATLGKYFAWLATPIKFVGKVVSAVFKGMMKILTSFYNWLKVEFFPALVNGFSAIKSPFLRGMVGLAGALLIMFGYFLVKWNGDWTNALKNMLVVAAVWGLQLLKWIVKIAAGSVQIFDIGLGFIMDSFATFFNWVIGKWNSFIEILANNKLVDKLGLADLVKKAQIDFSFDTNHTQNALGRFDSTQQAINNAFGDKLTQWQDLADEFTRVAEEHNAIKEGFGQGSAAELELEMQNIQNGLQEEELNMNQELADLKEQSLELDLDNLKIQEEKTKELEKQRDILLEISEISSGSGNSDILAEIKRRVGSTF